MINKIRIFCFISFFTCQFVWAQEATVTISGTITAAKTGESLLGVKVVVPKYQRGAVTNGYGFYSVTVPADTVNVEFRLGGFPNVARQVILTQDTILNIEMGLEVKEIEEMKVNAKRGENVNSTQMGQISLEIEKIKTLPAFFGEVDVIRTIQLLPGVNSATEGGQGFYVRGGGPDQNLVLLDEAVVYNAAHLFGFFSVFNVDAVKNVNLIKGGMPANFGGRMSSVLEVTMNEGNKKNFEVKGGLGLISSRLSVEGPINKGKGSFIVSGRRTYIDLIMKAAIPDSSPFAGSGYFFHDFNAKANYRLSDKDQIFISGYYGKDAFTFGNREDDFQVEMPWGNAIAALRWNHVVNAKMFMNTTISFTNYNFTFGSQQDEFRFDLSSGIRDYTAKVGFSYFPNSRHTLKFGSEYTFHTFTPISVAASQGETVFDTGLAQKLYSHETALYVLDEILVNEKWAVNLGLRYSAFFHVGSFTRYIDNGIGTAKTQRQYRPGELIQFYNGLEPRLSTRYSLGRNSSLKAGWAYNYQYIHLTSLSAVSLPTDIWYPSTDVAKPQKGYQASIGYFQNWKDDQYEASVEVYYKDLRNLIEYKDGALPSDNINDNTDNLLVFGRGYSYGAEFFLRRNFGKLNGWIGYTWSKTERVFDAINDGNPFPAKYDRRHDLSVVASYQLNPRLTFGSTFIYATGNTLTLPASYYIHNQELLFEYGSRNSTRMVPYHRLDLSVTLYDRETKKKVDPVTNETIEVKKRFRSNYSLSVYNVYNRANPFFLYVDNDGSLLQGDFKITVKQVTLFPIIPSITWNFAF